MTAPSEAEIAALGRRPRLVERGATGPLAMVADDGPEGRGRSMPGPSIVPIAARGSHHHFGLGQSKGDAQLAIDNCRAP